MTKEITTRSNSGHHPVGAMVPQRTGGDVAFTSARTLAGILAASKLPGSSIFTDALFDLIGPPLQRRDADFLQGLADRLCALEQSRGIDLSALFEDPEFLSLFVHARLAALRAHQQEKHDALRAILVHSADRANRSGFDLPEVFIRCVDELHPTQVAILVFLSGRFFMSNEINSYADLLTAFGHTYELPDWVDVDGFRMLCSGLEARGLAAFSDTLDPGTDFGGPSKIVATASLGQVVKVTSLGSSFLVYLKSDCNLAPPPS